MEQKNFIVDKSKLWSLLPLFPIITTIFVNYRTVYLRDTTRLGFCCGCYPFFVGYDTPSSNTCSFKSNALDPALSKTAVICFSTTCPNDLSLPSCEQSRPMVWPSIRLDTKMWSAPWQCTQCEQNVNLDGCRGRHRRSHPVLADNPSAREQLRYHSNGVELVFGTFDSPV